MGNADLGCDRLLYSLVFGEVCMWLFLLCYSVLLSYKLRVVVSVLTHFTSSFAVGYETPRKSVAAQSPRRFLFR